MHHKRDELLKLSDADLLRLCNADGYRASGPGGQHRNTTDTAVRLTLPGGGYTAYATGSRSQHQNRAAALKKLRLTIALEWREQEALPGARPPRVGKKHAEYPLFIAWLLDALERTDWHLGVGARAMGVTTGQLNRILADDVTLWRHVNQKRIQRGLRPLRLRDGGS